MPSAAALHELIQRQRGPADRLYAIVDSARDPDLARAAFERFGLERWSLFPADTDASMVPVAPYLVPVPFEPKYPFTTSGFLEAWTARLGGCSGILFASKAEPRLVWEHCRNLFQVVDEDGKEFYFRFYDPRVVRPLLSTLAADQVREFFGPIGRYFIEGQAGEMVVCRADEGTVRIERVAV